MAGDHRPRAVWLRYKTQVAMNWVRGELGRGQFHAKDFQINKINIEIKSLPRSFENYRIVHITDIHLGQWLTPERLDGVIELVNRERPDLVVLTGDYFSWRVGDYTAQLVKSLRAIRARDGVYTVLGNHDHWVGAEQIREILRDSAIVDLSNDVRTISRDGERLHIAGVDSVTEQKDDLDLVLKKLKDPGPAILLVHEPDFADETARTGRFILELSGHSHGGQLVIPYLGPIVRGHGFRKYPLGLYHVNGMVQYTNRGLGTNWFWIRVNCPPEIAVFDLQRQPRGSRRKQS